MVVDDMSPPSTTESLKVSTVSAKIGPVSKPPARGLSPTALTAARAQAPEIQNLVRLVTSSRNWRKTGIVCVSVS
uniref:Uncharacterized protein n=1 Tax=Solanum lycopersicum TaxID=4081 RepID=A0A3Q7H162_SOLLC